MNVLVPLPFVLPLAGAAVAMLVRRNALLLRVLSCLVLAGVIAAGAGLVGAVAGEGGPVAAQPGGWPAPLGITLVADRLSALLVVVSGVVLLAILAYAIGEGVSGLGEDEPAAFYPVYLLLSAGVCLVFVAGDLFNLFVGFEIMLASSYVLITLAPTRSRVQSGMTYTVVSLTSSILFLTAISLTYAATGTVNLAQLAERIAELPEGPRTALGLLFLMVFGIKAAIVPLHLWLPDSYPTALTKITAVFAALLTKVAMYALIRVQTLLFPREHVSVPMLVLAAATMIVGMLGALVQDDIHRILSFTLVGHIGYMLFGLALFSRAGLAGAILYLVHHIVVQATIFLVSDIIQQRTGEISLRRLGGLAGASPATAALFLVPALTIGGVPPLSGFVAKLALLRAGFGSPAPAAYAVAGVALLASLLTLVAMAKIWALAFWRPRPLPLPPPRNSGGTRLMAGTTVVMIVAGLLVAALAGPLAGWSLRAAGNLVDREGYVTAVLGGDR